MKEEKATDSNLIDSSIWLAYLFEGEHKEIIESSDVLFISTLSLFEIKRKLLTKSIPESVINEKLKFIKERVIPMAPTELIAEQAASLSIKEKMPAIDSLVYATAINSNAILITRDNDFRGLKNVLILG